MKNKTVYEIIPGENAPCELWSVVKTNFGGDARNFICEGTHTYCKQIMESLGGSLKAQEAS